MRVASFVLVAMLLAGCATTANYEVMLRSWVGKSESDLVSAWGQPDSVYQMTGGAKSVRYSRAGSVYIPGQTTVQQVTTNTSGSVYGSAGAANYNAKSTTYVPQQQPGMQINLSCVTEFKIDDHGTIVNWHWQGNDCKARAK